MWPLCSCPKVRVILIISFKAIMRGKTNENLRRTVWCHFWNLGSLESFEEHIQNGNYRVVIRLLTPSLSILWNLDGQKSHRKSFFFQLLSQAEARTFQIMIIKKLTKYKMPIGKVLFSKSQLDFAYIHRYMHTCLHTYIGTIRLKSS